VLVEAVVVIIVVDAAVVIMDVVVATRVVELRWEPLPLM
jgi:hypothetical protein